ncbi:MAG: MerR family transcriptional regulator [Candidatus Omnitrophota bacterium]|nr:MerR family transcriptional regulator [Candidatus Omnitrophota bacterium]
MEARLISAKDLMKKYNVTYQTLNHYTNFGLLDVVTKSGNARMFDEAYAAERLRQIAKMKELGYPLRLIRKTLLENKEPRLL